MDIFGQDMRISTTPAAFGDGSHETTRFLLSFLDRYAEGRTVLDIGCGSGILSIFAEKRGASSVTAVDFDPNAIECTRKNAKANGSDITIILKDISKLELKADIVTINFARWDALAYLPYAKKLVDDGGLLFTSWYKELPKDILEEFEIVDHTEGIEYDGYILRKESK